MAAKLYLIIYALKTSYVFVISEYDKLVVIVIVRILRHWKLTINKRETC